MLDTLLIYCLYTGYTTNLVFRYYSLLIYCLDTKYTANLLFYDGGIYLEGQLYGSDYPLETLWRVWDLQVEIIKLTQYI